MENYLEKLTNVVNKFKQNASNQGLENAGPVSKYLHSFHVHSVAVTWVLGKKEFIRENSQQQGSG